MTEQSADSWGITSPRVLFLSWLIEEEIATNVDALRKVAFTSTYGNIEPSFARKIELTNRINALSKDLRSALTAYAHKVHEPRPRVTTIAEAQGTTTQGLLRRYNTQTEEAVRAVAAGTATKQMLLKALPSLSPALVDRFLSAGTDEYFSARLDFPGSSATQPTHMPPLEVDLSAFDPKRAEL